MPESCCAPGCTNRREKGSDIQFYRIPAESERKHSWLSAINRKGFVPSKYTRLCSAHFISGAKSNNPLSPDYIPSIFNHVSTPQKKRKRASLEAFGRRQSAKKRRLNETGESSAAEALLELSFQENSNQTDSVQVDNSGSNVLQHCGSEMCTHYFNKIEAECQSLRTENIFLKEKHNASSFDECALSGDDDKVRSTTGIPTFAKLMVLFNTISPFLKHKTLLSPFQQFMLTMLRLRFGVSLTFLSHIYGVSLPTISRAFIHTINVMHAQLVPPLVFWPNRDELYKTLPMSFRNSVYKKCACIIDCFEIFIEIPGNFKARAQTYSSYKSHNTMKYLIGITPQGTVSFVSKGWGGRTSDKHITENSGFLNKILPGDLILADRGFLVHDSIGLQQGELKIPAFTKGKKQLNPIDIEETRGLAAVRIHVERVIGVVRQKYTILQSTIPISMLDAKDDFMILDKIVHVCCALTNVCGSVVPTE